VLTAPPQFLFEISGASLYDWRLDSSVGGAGPHRWADPSTWTPTSNPIVIAYNYKRGLSFAGDLFCGMEMQAIDLPLAKWTLAANICDEVVGTRKRYVCSIGLDCFAEHGDNIDALMKSCGGLMVNGVDGAWPIVGTSQTPVATLTDFDLVVGQPVEIQLRRAMDDLVNSVGGTFPNPENQWSPAGYQTATSGALLAADRRTRDVAMNFDTVPNAEQAAQLASIYLSENRHEGTASIVVRPKWQKLEQGDWIVWDSARYGSRVWMVTDLQVMSMDSDGPRNVRLTLQQRSGSIYDAVTVVEPVVPLGPAEPVYQAELLDFSVTAGIGSGADSRVYPMIRVAWSQPIDPTVSGAIIEWRLKDQPATVFDRAVTVDRTVSLLAEGIVSQTDYQVRHKLVTDPPRVTAWSAWKEVTTLDAPVNDISVGLGQVQNDIHGTLTGIRSDLDDYIARLSDIATSVSLSGLANYNTVSAVGERVGRAEASITTEQEVRASQTEAIAAQLVTFNASLGTTNATLANEALTRADADGSLASDISALSSSVGDNAAAIVAEALARTDADGSLASSITALNTDFDGRFASGLVKFEAQAAPGGVDARFAVMLRAGTGDAFKEAGFYLDLKTVLGEQVSEFVVDADRFVVTDGAASGSPLVFEGSELKLNAARIGTVVFDQLSSANGKLVIKGSGSNASIQVFS